MNKKHRNNKVTFKKGMVTVIGSNDDIILPLPIKKSEKASQVLFSNAIKGSGSLSDQSVSTQHKYTSSSSAPSLSLLLPKSTVYLSNKGESEEDSEEEVEEDEGEEEEEGSEDSYDSYEGDSGSEGDFDAFDVDEEVDWPLQVKI